MKDDNVRSKVLPKETVKTLEHAEARIRANEWDVGAWLSLVGEAVKLSSLQNQLQRTGSSDQQQEQQEAVIQQARELYERFLEQFPSSGQHWKLYVDMEMRYKHYERVEKIFHRVLNPEPSKFSCPYLELWRGYITYVRVKSAAAAASAEGQLNVDNIISAYEFVLDVCGDDIDACSLWLEYIGTLKDIPVKEGDTFQEGQKIVKIRRAYQRAIGIPMANVSTIWRQYDQFENGLNKVLAKELLNKHSPRYMSARTVFAERKKYYDRVQRDLLAHPAAAEAAQQQPNRRRNVSSTLANQMIAWGKLIEYEKSNSQALDKEALDKRVAFTYNQALLNLYRSPQMWIDAAQYFLSQDDEVLGKSYYARALVALPNNLLVSFAYADALEKLSDIDGSLQVYERLIEKKGDACPPLVYIQLLRASCRARGLDAARKVFVRAIKAPKVSYHVFVASALMEFRVSKDARIARNIFQLGLKKFIDEPAFVLEYVNFLSHLNEDNNMRVLFERVLKSASDSPRTREIYQKFLNFEYESGGDLPSVEEIEKRFYESFPTDPTGVGVLVQRYRFLDLWPVSEPELSSFGTTQEHITALGGKTKSSAAASSSTATLGGSLQSVMDVASSTRAADRGDRRHSKKDSNYNRSLRAHLPMPPVKALEHVVKPDIDDMLEYRQEYAITNFYQYKPASVPVFKPSGVPKFVAAPAPQQQNILKNPSVEQLGGRAFLPSSEAFVGLVALANTLHPQALQHLPPIDESKLMAHFASLQMNAPSTDSASTIAGSSESTSSHPDNSLKRKSQDVYRHRRAAKLAKK